MKRVLSLFLAMVLVLSALPVLSLAAVIYDGTMFVKTGNGKSLNVRDIETGDVIGSLAYGSKVYVDQYVGDWAYIVWGSWGEAKVAKKYLINYYPGKYQGGGENVLEDTALGSQTVEGLNKQFSTLTYVTAYTVKVVPDTVTGTARLRWAPSKNSTLVAQLPAGYELTVLAVNKNWLMVQVPLTGQIGYIAAKYTSAK